MFTKSRGHGDWAIMLLKITDILCVAYDKSSERNTSLNGQLSSYLTLFSILIRYSITLVPIYFQGLNESCTVHSVAGNLALSSEWSESKAHAPPTRTFGSGTRLAEALTHTDRVARRAVAGLAIGLLRATGPAPVTSPAPGSQQLYIQPTPTRPGWFSIP